MDLSEFRQSLAAENPPFLREVWPSERSLSFEEALRLLDPQAAAALDATAKFVEGVSAVPVLAVAGAINGGKSSLVGTFLSEAGRERVLTGVGRDQGTQRFVLWIPEKWRTDAGFSAQLEKLVASVFGKAPESLADDPAEAHEQYRALEGFEIPLLASDPGLDHHGIALLDCPDIQRPQTGEVPGRNARLEAVRKASEICAGIILVTPRAQLEVREIASLVEELIPKAVRIFAVNMIRPPEKPHAVREELERALGEPVTRCYGAYDFEIGASRSFTPAWDPGLHNAGDQVRLPCFFSIDPVPEKNEPEAVAPDRSILALSTQLPPGQMQQQRQWEMQRAFVTEVERLSITIENEVDRRETGIGRAAAVLLERCEELLRDENGRLRTKMDPRIIASFQEAMERTAPFYLRPFMLAHRAVYSRAARVIRAGRNKLGRIFGILEKQPDFDRMRNRLKQRLIQAPDVERELDRWSIAIHDKREPGFWAETAAAILARYQEEEKTNMTQEEWFTIARRIWKHAGKFRATVQIFGTFFLGLAAILLIPFDAGHSVLGMTVLEMFGVVGLSGIVTAGTLAQLDEEMTDKLAHQQLANLCAIAADETAVPAPSMQAALLRRKYPSPTVRSRPAQNGYGLRERKWQLFALHQGGVNALRKTISRWNKENR